MGSTRAMCDPDGLKCDLLPNRVGSPLGGSIGALLDRSSHGTGR